MTDKIERYGLHFPAQLDDAQIECEFIRRGGTIKLKGQTYGKGLYHHYYRLFRLYWPHEDEHRWEQASLQAILDNQFTTLMGCTGSTKTSTGAKFALAFYSVWPKGTTILISSTDLRGLELRIFGRIKELIAGAKERFDWFPGNVLDSKKIIATDNIEEDEIRNLRDGIICVPCLSNTGKFVGLGKWIGIHNSRLVFIGDEFQLMQNSLLDAVPNLLNNPVAKFIFLGNPLAQNDPLDTVSEPAEGWASVGIPTKTTRWQAKYMNGLCLNLPGLDSPNFDHPADQPDRFKYMVGRYKERLTRESYGESSSQYVSQILGVRLAGLTARKVITREIVLQHNAMRDPIWHDDQQIRIYAVDAAYGSVGGDLCVGGWCQFGRELNGPVVFHVGPQKIVPIIPSSTTPPDDQIALFVRQECEAEGIPPENVYFDGRTLLMSAFARLWSNKPNPIDFGGRTTNRPVSLDMKVLDEKTNTLRPKLCSEHYSKFVTELWFSLRYAIESGQVAGLTEEILSDACPREFKTVRDGKYEIEAKHETRKRTGKSPDRTDHVVTALEGARRKGFLIAKLHTPPQTATADGDSWLLQHFQKLEAINRQHELA